ncbi:MAG: hypothetical protein P8I03_15580, partial [Thalassotalea sp.]|nr:hypothetical protein [Thalassotalea sp.]
ADDGTENVVFTVTKPGKPLLSLIDLSKNPDLSALSGIAQSFSLHVPTITGGTPPLTYTWSLGTNPHSITVTGADTDNPTVNFPAVPDTCNAIEGDITLTVSDSAGKTTTGTIHYKNNPAPQAIQPISCHVCRGPKFICERSHVSRTCAASDLSVAAKAAGRTVADLQYCMNDIENLKDGSRYVTRRCATADDVNNDWLKRIQATTAGSTLDNQCGKYNVVVLQDAHFSCALPCKGDNCNLESVPDVTIGLKAGNAQGIEFPVNLEPLPPKAGVCP